MLITTDPKTPAFSHRAYGLNPFISLVREFGLDPLPLLESAGIAAEALEKPDYTLSADQELEFMELSLQAISQPDLGLRCGPRYHLAFYGTLGLAAMTSANLMEAFRVMFKNVPMTWTYLHWELRTENGLGIIRPEKLRDLGGCYQYMIDRGLTAVYTIACDALGFRMPLIEVNICQPRPSYAESYTEAFQCPVNFDAPVDDMRFEEAYLYEALQQTEIDSARIFGAQCESICTKLTENDSFSEVIRQHLWQLPDQMASLEAIAERLHTTPRSIQRKLASEHTSYHDLVENVRRNLAIEYLRTTGLTVTEIAQRLGYADAPSFGHAFKRWTGNSPGSLRQQITYD